MSRTIRRKRDFLAVPRVLRRRITSGRGDERISTTGRLGASAVTAFAASVRKWRDQVPDIGMKDVVLVNETLPMAGNSYGADIVAERYYPSRLCGRGWGYPPRTQPVRKNNLATIRGPGWTSSATILEGDFQLPAPLVEASSGHPQLSRQLNNIFAGLHALYSHPLKFPGVSSPLHPLVSSLGNCAHSCVSLQGFIRAQFRAQSGLKAVVPVRSNVGKCFRINSAVHVGA